MFRDERTYVPIGGGETYNVTIQNIARLGNGIVRIEGFVVFVPSNETVDDFQIKLEKVRPNFAFSTVVE